MIKKTAAEMHLQRRREKISYVYLLEKLDGRVKVS